MAISPVRLDEPAANTSTRRSLLTAIAALPLLATSARLPSMAIDPNVVIWDRALAAWREADAAADYHHKHVYNVARAKLDKFAPSQHSRPCQNQNQSQISLLADENDRLNCEAVEREAVLMTLPAPNESALLWKLEHLFRDQSRGHNRESDTIIGEWCDVLTADARRLLVA